MDNLQEKLKESRDRLRLIADSVPALIAYVDKEKRYVFCNEAYHEWFGISVKKIAGAPVEEIFDVKTYRSMKPHIEQVLTGKQVEYEIEHVHRKYGLRINKTTLTPHFNAQHAVIGFCVLSIDVTDIKRSEAIAKEYSEELRLTLQKLERSNHELEQFAAVCSHDLKEPLRMVKGYVDLLQKKYDRLFDEKSRTYFNYIVEGTARMEELINNLLDYARMEEHANTQAKVDMKAALKKAIDNLGLHLAENDISITSGFLPEVDGNDVQLVRLLQNLLSNAIKFRRDIPPQIHIDAERHESDWLFSVKDNGIGIASQHGEKIFKIFKRLHSHDAYPGTGIGLSECKKIVENHGGRIWYESKEGKGTTFFFTLPTGRP